MDGCLSSKIKLDWHQYHNQPQWKIAKKGERQSRVERESKFVSALKMTTLFLSTVIILLPQALHLNVRIVPNNNKQQMPYIWRETEHANI